jgi:hypothetical protein
LFTRSLWDGHEKENGLNKEENMPPPHTCPSHEHIASSINRQETILEEFRKENSIHKEDMSRTLATICAQLETIREIKTTQIENMRRREDFAKGCEEKRTDLWTEINRIKSRQNQKDGTMVIIAGVCTSIGAAVTWLITWLQKHP